MTAEEYYRLGNKFRKEGNWQEALNNYIEAIELDPDSPAVEAKKMLRSGKMTIYQIAYELSFSTPSHFGTFFRKHTGKTPKEFIKSTEITSRNEAFPQE